MRHCCAPDPQHNTASLVLVSPVPHEGPSAELDQDNQCAMQSSSIYAAPYVFYKVCPVLCVLTMVLCSLLMDNSGLSTWVTWPVGGTLCSRRYQCEVFFGITSLGMHSLCQGSLSFASSLSRRGTDDHVQDLSMALASLSRSGNDDRVQDVSMALTSLSRRGTDDSVDNPPPPWPSPVSLEVVLMTVCRTPPHVPRHPQ